MVLGGFPCNTSSTHQTLIIICEQFHTWRQGMCNHHETCTDSWCKHKSQTWQNVRKWVHSCNGNGTIWGKHFFELSQVFLHATVNIITVAGKKTQTQLLKYSPLSATCQNQQILALCLQQQASQGKWDLLDTCDLLNSTDCKYLQRNGVKSYMHCHKQKIRQGTSHHWIHWWSSWHHCNINKPPSRKCIMQNALFKQRGVRMTSSTGDYLLSAYDEDTDIDHHPVEVLAAPWSRRSALLQWLHLKAVYIYPYKPRPVFGLVVAIDGLVVAISIKLVVLFGGTDTPPGLILPPLLYTTFVTTHSKMFHPYLPYHKNVECRNQFSSSYDSPLNLLLHLAHVQYLHTWKLVGCWNRLEQNYWLITKAEQNYQSLVSLNTIH